MSVRAAVSLEGGGVLDRGAPASVAGFRTVGRLSQHRDPAGDSWGEATATRVPARAPADKHSPGGVVTRPVSASTDAENQTALLEVRDLKVHFPITRGVI